MTQLALNLIDTTFPPPVERPPDMRTVAERLADLLAGNLDFHEEKSNTVTHSLHAFAAKFPPQIPRIFIETLTAPGNLVLDPMVGSGTTLVEAFLLGRCAIGVDIDPLARMICRVKTSRLPAYTAELAGIRALNRAAKAAEDPLQVEEFMSRLDAKSRDFVDYWFLPQTQREIAAFVLSIEQEPDLQIKEFLILTLSSAIITKSGGVSLARDLAHSRPHKDMEKTPRSTFDQFRKGLLKGVKALAELPTEGNGTQILEGDARTLPVEGGIDLVVTSPPYANAIDYMRAHKFSLVWLGHSITALSEHRSRYIGSERIDNNLADPLPPATEEVLSKLGSLDPKKQKIVRKYFTDMRRALAEMHRVLNHDRACILVVGSSTMRGYLIPTHECIGQLGEAVGFTLVGIAERKLDRNRRMMPARFGRSADSTIEQRMNEEYIVGFIKP